MVITSTIRISGNGICSETQDAFVRKVLRNELEISQEEKAHFINFMENTVYGTLMQVEKSQSIRKFYDRLFRQDQVTVHLGDPRVILETFFYQECEHADFPRVGKIRIFSRGVPLEEGAPGEDSQIICYREEGDSVWTIRQDETGNDVVRKGEYVFFVSLDGKLVG